MKWNLLILLHSLFSCIFLLSCKDSGTGPNDEEMHQPRIYVQITDMNGNPLSDVGIHFYDDNWLFGGNYLNLNKMGNSTLGTVMLKSFTATLLKDIILRPDWEAETEIDTAGLGLLRAEIGKNYLFLEGYQTNRNLQGNTPTQMYHYIDENTKISAHSNRRQFDVDLTGNSHENDSLTGYIQIPVQSEYILFQNYPNPFNASTSIRFSLPQSEQVLIQVENWWNSEPVRNIIDLILPAGTYIIVWDGKNDEGQYVTNNLYTYQMTAGGFTDLKELFLNMIDPEAFSVLNSIPLAQSDSQGNLQLNYDILPIGKTIYRTDEIGADLGTLIISDSLSLVFIKEGYRSLTKKVLIDSTKIINIFIVLEK